MDILVWFIEKKTMVSAVTKEGVMALSGMLFSEEPVYVIQIASTPQELLQELPEGVVACSYIDGLLHELEPENKKLQ